MIFPSVYSKNVLTQGPFYEDFWENNCPVPVSRIAVLWVEYHLLLALATRQLLAASLNRTFSHITAITITEMFPSFVA